jgi:predicted nucleic acid-binding protein
MIVLDASFLIAHFKSTDAHHERAKSLLVQAALTPLAASTVTVAEVLTGHAKRGRMEVATTFLRELDIHRIPLDAYMSEPLAQVRADTNLKLPDCCVILAAEQAQADSVATFDDQLAKAARDRGLTVLT